MTAIDLRSDTITRPTAAMRQAMADAEVGDDVFGEDPTVRRLEEMAARRLGKPAALLVASGTMGNLVAQLAHCGRGDETILGDQSHVFFYEQGGASALGGIHPRTLPNQPDGTIAIEKIEAAIRPDDVHFPTSRLIILENTHNRCHGTPLSPAYTASVAELAAAHGLKLHIDGARIFNAAGALGVDAAELAAPADSITFCLSKGLAAPVGSLLCGDEPFIRQARRVRKSLGGGMRQAGVIAAAGIVALNEMVDRLAEDHANARALAVGLAEIPGLAIDPLAVATNIVYFQVTTPGLDASTMVARLAAEGVRLLPTAPDQMRAVTNCHVTAEDIQRALAIFHGVMR
ncbi:low-specificity L-threonine aldolase [Desulfosarcina ovata]|uniref:Threonine aldolase n=2 Tax=Desulfosarcina ovata TaxID=83564 RepID=A0A5K8AG02_9BACT|nr:low-specificity L-threonine aldolase [Desulfosarcina ovata]BBO82968.1 threonine aldolase [Desulfosarcina ovata subsp. sediminis]BBO91622.1 threonine aldolase [Desulfosarcina ovata subsp. ovata]